jgi:hypothetical protein
VPPPTPRQNQDAELNLTSIDADEVIRNLRKR